MSRLRKSEKWVTIQRAATALAANIDAVCHLIYLGRLVVRPIAVRRNRVVYRISGRSVRRLARETRAAR